jgi:hypothetical protein
LPCISTNKVKFGGVYREVPRNLTNHYAREP